MQCFLIALCAKGVTLVSYVFEIIFDKLQICYTFR